MSQPLPRSAAYMRRNQTTHSWYDTSAMLSQSLPTSGFLHRQYRSSSACSTPRSSTSDYASAAGKSTLSPRPSSSYSYDGGFFVGAHSGQAEYFVIHPDWVSEAMTIKKLSIGNKKNNITHASIANHPSKSRIKNSPSRRCLSAPPSKLRNPITGEQTEARAIPRARAK